MIAITSRRILMLLSTLLFGQSVSNAAEIRDRITPEQMRRSQASIEWRQEGGDGSVRDPRVRPPVEQSILKQSVILCDGRFWSLVPKGSILHLPERHDQRIVDRPTGQPISWNRFLALNRSWLTTHEVDIPTASGKKPVADQVRSFWATRNHVVVAIHLGGAISVKPPKPVNQSTNS